jgi:phage regulator Rha-like protein
MWYNGTFFNSTIGNSMTKQIKLNETATMTSLEIAELTGKQHSHVMRDIESTLKELCQVSDDSDPQSKVGLRLHDGISEYMKPFEGTYKHHTGMGYQNRPMYILPKFECDLVISGYSVKYRAAIIKRWHELEAQAASHLSARLGAKFQHKALGQALYQERGKETPSYIYSNESNMFNAIILGMTSKKFKEMHSLGKNDLVRDHMTPFQLEAIEELQFMGASMIKRGWNYAERKNKLTLHYNENLLRIEGKELNKVKTKTNKELAKHHLKEAKALLAK